MKLKKNNESEPVALVTGASRGLGRIIALRLSENGYRVIVNYHSSDDKAYSVVREIGGDSHAIKADVGDMDQVKGMTAEIEERFGRLDAVINNAGITRDNLLLRQTEREWDEIISTNLRGCFNIIKTTSPFMIKSGGGHIINISSYSGVKGKPGQAAYSASKAAILGLTYTAAAELAEYNIKVNVILPGYMMTEMGTKASKAMERAKKDSLKGNLSDPEDTAKFAVYLLNTENITGQVFSLDSRTL